MKNITKILLSITAFILLLTGCAGKANFESQLVGTWYPEGSQEAAFVLYDDGTCEIAGEYGTGTWSVVNDNQLKLTNYYGETQTAPIIGVENGSLTLGEKDNYVKFWSTPQEEVQEVTEIDKLENNHSETDNTQESKEIILENSKVRIVNTIEDGTLWVIEEDQSGQRYLVHTNIYGEVIEKAKYEFDGYIERGIDDKLFAMDVSKGGISDLHIYDISTLEDVSYKYKGDFDEIISCMQTDHGVVFTVRKIVESFDENYACLKLVDTSGKELFSISLESDILLNKYNINPFNTPEDMQINYAGNNVYYIAHIGSQYDEGLNSLIIDLNRNKVIPIDFPQKALNQSYCSSDGTYTLISSYGHGTIVVNQETGTFESFPNSDYTPEGKLSEGVFYADGGYGFGTHENKAFLDLQGNVVIDLNQYPQKVKEAYPFINGAALIEFSNDYLTYIDTNGDFLFEPVEGFVLDLFEDVNIANGFQIKKDEDNVDILIDQYGNVNELNFSGQNGFFVKYEGKYYFVAGGESGLQKQEYTFSNATYLEERISE